MEEEAYINLKREKCCKYQKNSYFCVIVKAVYSQMFRLKNMCAICV